MEKIGKKKEIKTPFCFGNESMPPRRPLLVHRGGKMN